MRKTSGQLRLKKKAVPISTEKEQEILAYFKSTKDNRMTVVAEIFGVSHRQVNRIVDIDIASNKIKNL